ncbi:hypothetical protein BKE30_07340 [Alkanindiges hydrocarboniclasticus]|uniref:Uncharacterized protein n=1 Tax=Alkanindiges hydrocarboniclasticus TaxID=1907941 RepID=A0A1S8CWQ2_9GAMM|nr:hypothetical protein BKE30_07340 [Alkanindiges hydrocarboniclasticus]
MVNLLAIFVIFCLKNKKTDALAYLLVSYFSLCVNEEYEKLPVLASLTSLFPHKKLGLREIQVDKSMFEDN